MISAYIVLGLPRDASDAQIRQRYLELVRAHPPSRDPDQFQRVAEAYEALKTPEARVATRLFFAEKYSSFEEVVEEMERAAAPEWSPPGLRELVDAEGL